MNEYVVFYDLAWGQQIATPEMCDELELELINFVGFTDESEALVSCDGYAYGNTDIFETVDLNTGRASRLSEEPSDYVFESGDTTGTFTITDLMGRN